MTINDNECAQSVEDFHDRYSVLGHPVDYPGINRHLQDAGVSYLWRNSNVCPCIRHNIWLQVNISH